MITSIGRILDLIVIIADQGRRSRQICDYLHEASKAESDLQRAIRLLELAKRYAEVGAILERAAHNMFLAQEMLGHMPISCILTME